ncbi:MAG: hypothetical protein IKA63_06020, partial [Clostridia bacterium]|nr:hypothetical protein [Clostridia bacterium]
VSKSFLLITLCTFLIWIVGCFFEKGKLSTKLTLFFVIFVGVCFLVSATFFSDLMDMMLSRILKSRNLSDLTTKRIDLWIQYFLALKEEPALLFFGRGATKILINGRASHNTVIQLIYQFGVLGFTSLVGWLICYIKTMLLDVKFGSKNFIWLCLLLVGTIGPWMALDLLFFDEFFLMPIYICSGILFLSKEKNLGKKTSELT